MLNMYLTSNVAGLNEGKKEWYFVEVFGVIWLLFNIETLKRFDETMIC